MSAGTAYACGSTSSQGSTHCGSSELSTSMSVFSLRDMLAPHMPALPTRRNTPSLKSCSQCPCVNECLTCSHVQLPE